MPTTTLAFDVAALRADFPILGQTLNGNPLVYLDNAATTQKPQVVIDALVEYYTQYNANIHRGLHTLAERATAAYEHTRGLAQGFINADEREEIVFTTGTTGGINLVAATYGRMVVNAGDEVVISAMEHHSNIVPWQMLCEQKGATLRVIPMSDEGVLDIAAAERMIGPKTKIVSVVWASNSLGTVNPVKQLAAMAHAAGAVLVVDAAQAIGHFEVDVQALDADFLAFSSHKLFGPTGIGVLYGKRALLEAMPPYQGGGEMIKDVTFERTTYNDLPYKFEAGTPNIADVIAFGRALEYVQGLDRQAIEAHEATLLARATAAVQAAVPDVRIVGQATDKISVLSFVVPGATRKT